MKLIQCRECGDVYSLSHQRKCCTCTATSGWYEDDGLHAVATGPATLIGFHNTRFREAKLDASIDPDPTRGKRFEAFVICDPCPTFRRLT